jgi:hypothetical protein
MTVLYPFAATAAPKSKEEKGRKGDFFSSRKEQEKEMSSPFLSFSCLL